MARMNGLGLLLTTLTGRPRAAVLGDCIVCGSAVREGDDRLTVRGGHVHTGCAGYRMRRLATRRDLGSRDRNAAFTGD